MPQSSNSASYTEGSVFGHISTLALTSAVGMFAIMIVDLADMYFISILGEPSLAAAVGFAGLGLFLGASYLLFGLQLGANPVFTSLRHPGFATLSNIIRDLVLAIPLIYLLSAEFGSRSVLAGQALANALAGIIAFATAYWMSGKVQRGERVGPNWSTIRLHRERHVVPGVQHRG